VGRRGEVNQTVTPQTRELASKIVSKSNPAWQKPRVNLLPGGRLMANYQVHGVRRSGLSAARRSITDVGKLQN
jgi:hypothetical protein